MEVKKLKDRIKNLTTSLSKFQEVDDAPPEITYKNKKSQTDKELFTIENPAFVKAAQKFYKTIKNRKKGRKGRARTMIGGSGGGSRGGARGSSGGKMVNKSC